MLKLIIIGTKYGQLGNRLHTFSNCIVFAKEYGYKVINPCFEDYQDFFGSTKNKPFVCWPEGKSFFKKNFISKWINNFIYRFCLSDKVLRFLKYFVYILKGDSSDILKIDCTEVRHALKNRKIIILKSWDLKFDKLTEKYKRDICGYFKPTEKVDVGIKNYFLGPRKEYNCIIGLHIRKRDYKTHLGGKFYYTDDIYFKIASHLNGLFNSKKVIFLIFSNEKINLDSFNGINIATPSGSTMEDLYSMAKCDFLIGPPSTFSSWASFYGNVPYYAIFDVNKLPRLEDFKLTKSI